MTTHAEYLQLVAAVGRDCFVAADEFVGASSSAAAIWQTYRDQFDAFTGAHLDPQFHRFDHQHRQVGSLQVPADETVVVVGTGPSLAASARALHQVRDRVHLVTSVRGAAALDQLGLAPDLVLVAHASPLDAQVSVDAAQHLDPIALPNNTWVAIEARTPLALLAGFPTDRMFVPDPYPSWGLWPATAAALALDAGAARVALLGVDLGDATGVNPTHEALVSLLALLSRAADGRTVDCGALGARKPGWPVTPVSVLADGPEASPLSLRIGSSVIAYHADAVEGLRTIKPFVNYARDMLDSALAVRAGHSSRPAQAGLADACRTMMSWRRRPRLRAIAQDVLGLSFLPRLWRIGLDVRRCRSLWQPVVLSLHELIAQAERLEAQLARVGS